MKTIFFNKKKTSISLTYSVMYYVPMANYCDIIPVMVNNVNLLNIYVNVLNAW